jgi:hypothetical protein
MPTSNITIECSKCKDVLDLIREHGGIDGGHHKQWLLDRILRAILGGKYGDWVHDYNFEETDGDGNPGFEWDTGVAP